MKAYTVVGPTNFQPCFFNAFDKAIEAGEVDSVCGSGRCFSLGSKLQMRAAKDPCLLHEFRRALGVVDHGVDLAAVAHDACVAEQPLHVKGVVVVPGYGMAVARAQHAVNEMTEVLRGKGVNVRFAIHPAAGRLPGHMNVVLAEANVPYDIVLEMDEINDELPETDVVMVIRANDIVNPSAQNDTDSPIYGMPVLEVRKSAMTVVMKRSRATGYAGVDNRTQLTGKVRRDAKEPWKAVSKVSQTGNTFSFVTPSEDDSVTFQGSFESDSKLKGNVKASGGARPFHAERSGS